MENEERIEKLITKVIALIKDALEYNQAREAMNYAETLTLLQKAKNMLSPNWAHNKPFTAISDKHIPDA